MRRFLYIAFAILMLILPIVIVSLLLSATVDAGLFDHVPFYNDELYHWHQSASFAEVGFNSGYYTLNENIPIADFSHYYAWGAWVYVIYGTLGNIFGITLNSVMVFNLGLYLLAGMSFIALAKPSREGLIFTGVILSTFIPLLLYIPSSMLQVLNLAISIVIAGAFYRVLTQAVSWRFMIPITIFITLTGLIRPTYALYLPPLFALAFRERTIKSTLLAGVYALPLVLIGAIGFYTSAAPFPHFRTLLFLGDDALTTKLANLGAYLQQSFIWLTEGAPIVMGQRFQILLLIILLMAWGIYRWRNHANDTPTKNEDKDTWGWELALHLYNLVGFYSATIIFHETLGGHDYRVMAPHFLFSLLLLVLFQRRLLYLPMIALSLFLMPAMLDEYVSYKSPNFADTVPQQFADWKSTLGDDLNYEPDAPSPWCNTVMTSAFYVLDAAGTPGMLLSVDAGMGLSWTFDWVFPDFDLPVPDEYKIPDTFQSRYLILTDDDYQRFGQTLNLQRIERAPNGALYRNLDAPC